MLHVYHQAGLDPFQLNIHISHKHSSRLLQINPFLVIPLHLLIHFQLLVPDGAIIITVSPCCNAFGYIIVFSLLHFQYIRFIGSSILVKEGKSLSNKEDIKRIGGETMFTSRVIDTLQIKYPIIQAGMAGAITTPELVAAVSNSGGLERLEQAI